MTVHLPDLGDAFTVAPLNPGNLHAAKAGAGTFAITPGVYLLSREPKPDRARLPAKVGQVGLAEFVCPPAPALPAQVLPALPAEFAADQPLNVGADMVDARPPRTVTLRVRAAGETAFRSVTLTHGHGYRYAATLPAGTLTGAAFDYFFEVETAGGDNIRHPAKADATLSARLTAPAAPVTLFDAAQDGTRLAYTRIGDTVRRGVFKNMPATATDPAALRLMFPLSLDRELDDYTASLAIKDRIAPRRTHLSTAKILRINARSAQAGQGIVVTLVESDGTAWSAPLHLTPDWQELRVPLADLQLAQGVLLPLGYPGRWNYWGPPAKGRGAAGDGPRLAEVEHVQISFRPALAGARPKEPGPDAWADVASVSLAPE